MKLHNLCGNCNEEFHSNLIVREIIIECPSTVDQGGGGYNSKEPSQWKSIKVASALSFIYKLGYIEQLPHIDQDEEEDDENVNDEEIAVCGGCADDLTNLWKFYEQLARRRRVNSYVAKKIDKLDAIFHEIQITWSKLVGDTGWQESDDDDDDDDVAPGHRRPVGKQKFVPKIDKYEDDVPGPSQSQKKSKKGKASARLRIKEKQEHDESDSNPLDHMTVDFEDGEDETSSVSLEPATYDGADPLAIFENEDEGLVTTESTAVESTLQCPICSDSFLAPVDLSDHWFNEHTEKGTTICPLPSCRRSFASSSYIKVHLDGHVDYKRFACTVAGCSKAFMTLGNLQRHIISCRNGRATKVKPRVSKALLSHLSSGTSGSGSKPQVKKNVTNSCPLCQRTHASSADLAAHLFSSHIEEDTRTCPICNREVGGKGPLRMHIYAHAGGKVSCNKNNSTVQIRERMRDSAGGDLGFDGTQHRKLESQRQNFKKFGGHVHPARRPLPATRTTTMVSFSSKMKKKKRKGRRYVCTSCRKVCRSAFALKLHKRIHTGEKPYKCGLCRYSSAQAGNLKVHLWQHAKLDEKQHERNEKDSLKGDVDSEEELEVTVLSPPVVIEIDEEDEAEVKNEKLMEVTNDEVMS